MRPQVQRLLILFGLVGLALLVARAVLVPKTFGQKGHYRAAAIDAVASHGPHYAGHEQCEPCHPDVAEIHAAGRHAGVVCEVCHGPALAHVSSPTEVKPPKPRSRAFCARCHSYDPSRPTGFPQIDLETHNPPLLCTGCHQPHAPEPPRTPEECSACHQQIARTKAISPHAPLACTTCHQTPEEHKVNPRLSRASKPAQRAFCGRCHAPHATPPKELAALAEIPRVDLNTHYADYVCWQCHYPHYPEIGRGGEAR